MRFFPGIPVAALIVLLPASAPAQCFICDTVVELDDVTATCFQENAEAFMAAARNDPAARAAVNLKSCGEGRGLDGFPAFGAAEDTPARRGARKSTQRLVYLLDVEGIECVMRHLDSGWSGPTLRIDLGTDCN